MKQYKTDVNTPTPTVAEWNKREYQVERIVSHRAPSPNASRSRWEFKVHWEDYDDTEDSYIPFSEAQKLGIFPQYIRDADLPMKQFPRDKFPLPQD